MGFFDKIKNMFTEEVEEDEVKVERIKNDVTHVSIESPVSKKRSNDDGFENAIIENFDKQKEDTSKPVFFDDSDFKDLKLVETREKKVEFIHPQEKELYAGKIQHEYYDDKINKNEKEEKKLFKPTPIISPVYGVLDKNYHKEDIVSKHDKSDIEVQEDSIDSIRNKAYGTLEDELENTLFGNNSILFKKEESEDLDDLKDSELQEINDDSLLNFTEDISKELDELLVKKEKYSEPEETKALEDDNVSDDLLEFIDSTLYKEGE